MAKPSLEIGNNKWAIKEDNLLGYGISDTVFVPQPITMTRASAGTRVNSSGLVETVELLGSDLVTNGDFATDTDWTKGTGTTISGGLANLDGSAGAFVSALYQDIPLISGKTYKITFNISNFSSGSLRIRFDQSFTAIGNMTQDGFYEFTKVAASNDDRINFVTNAINTICSIDNVSVKESTKNNLARVDYDGTASSLLVEPERTNLVTYSESYGSGTYFSATNGSVIDNTTSISPSGENNATQITSTGAGKLQSSGQSLTQNTDYVLSFYAKNVDATEVKSRVLASGGSGGENLTSVSYISELSTTEWTRITHIFNTGTNTTFYVFLSNALNSGGTIQLWGAQLEEATYATSYIPTDGGTVTRVKDQYSKTGISNLINSEEGSFFVDIAALNQPPWAQISISLSGNGSNDRVLIYTGSGGGKWITQFRKAGTIIVNVEKSVTITNQSKVAISWKSGKYLMYIDGDKATNYTEGSETHSVTFDADDLKNLQFSPNHSSSSNYFNGKVKHLQVYTTALTDSELKTLTT